MKNLFLTLLSVVLFCGVSSCARCPVSPDDEVTKPEAINLSGTSWKLASIGGESVSNGVSQGEVLKPVSEMITLEFTTEQVAGKAPANSFKTNYKAGDYSISLGEIEFSDAYCGDGSVEPEFFHRLRATATYTATSEKLVLKQHSLATDDVPSSNEYHPAMHFVRVR